MEFRVCVVFSIVLIVGIAHNIVALPRDSTVVKTESLPVNSVNHDAVISEKKIDEETVANERNIPGRVWCQHDGLEPAEDELCQKHCIPKGYSYGLCVSNTCSCI